MNKITDVTRQAIADDTDIFKINTTGRLDEPNFWARLIDLKNLYSTDYRYKNAYEDINQHMVMNRDWDDNWHMTDPRIDMLHCPDDLYKRFLALTVHPSIRTDKNELANLLNIYNQRLVADGLTMIQTGDISGKPFYEVQSLGAGHAVAAANRQQIKKYLNTSYVDSKIKIMHDAVRNNTELAVGTGKELLETACKSILKQRVVAINKDWSLSQLFRETLKQFDFTPVGAEDPETAKEGINSLLSGVMNIVHGVGKLRNSYGTGHGKEADFQGLDPKYAALFVGLVSQVVILLLDTNGEQAELIEEPNPF